MKKLFYAWLASLFFITQAVAANIPYQVGPWEPANLGFYLNSIIQAVNSGITTGTALAVPKNLLDNGDFAISQRTITAGALGTATAATCGTTTIPESAYMADRWGCNVNVTSGAGTMATVTSLPAPLLGDQNAEVLYRTSGTLTQPICAMQEVPTIRSVAAQGQQVDFSVYLQALSGLNADNGNQADLFLFTGTGTDQGLGSFTTTVTSASVTVATTGIITYTNTLVVGQPVYFTAATIPTGFTANQYYYVSSTNLSTSQFSVATTYAAAIAGTVLAPSSAGTTVVVDVPYVTPAFTGLAVYGLNNAGQGQTTAAQAFGQAISQPLPITTAWVRYQTGLIQLPTNVTEAVVAVCFVPTLTGTPGTTDGLAMANAQFEVIGANGTGATSFEHKDPAIEIVNAYKFAYTWPEAASGVKQLIGQTLSTTSCDFALTFPYPMFKAPALSQIGTAITAGTTYKTNQAGTLYNVSAMATATANAKTSASFTVTAATMTNASGGCTLQGLAGGAVPLWGADF
jgi:hypothetical protein